MKPAPQNDRISDLKSQAKRLRGQLNDSGRSISHSQSLELIAQQNGARDWNTLVATQEKSSNNRPLAVGDRVTGRYLGQAFTGYVYGLSHHEHSKYTRVTLQFDDAVDVVTFDGFSNFRQRVSTTITDDLTSVQKTSDGVPHLRVEHVR